jgi:2-C-methyl-D-erythritol 4-phosphate cytidylyltransferase/2-C-methyl-D-erythritol 2,4-cyclodiphosphate synthase
MIKIKDAIETNKYDAVIPFINLIDTIKIKENNKIKTLNRDNLLSIQTPQAIKLNKKNTRHILENKINNRDESELFDDRNRFKIKYLLGDKKNFKITTKNDLSITSYLLNQSLRIGNAFDIHKLTKGNELILGGIKIPSKYKLVGHSDGDVVIHSIIDCILGALSKKDIGSYFPSTDQKLTNIDSTIMLKKIIKLNKTNNTIMTNIDVTIITEAVRLEKYKTEIKNNLSIILKCPKNKISIKAKSSDGIGIIGNSKAIACWTSMMIYKI